MTSVIFISKKKLKESCFTSSNVCISLPGFKNGQAFRIWTKFTENICSLYAAYVFFLFELFILIPIYFSVIWRHIIGVKIFLVLFSISYLFNIFYIILLSWYLVLENPIMVSQAFYTFGEQRFALKLFVFGVYLLNVFYTLCVYSEFPFALSMLFHLLFSLLKKLDENYWEKSTKI